MGLSSEPEPQSPDSCPTASLFARAPVRVWHMGAKKRTSHASDLSGRIPDAGIPFLDPDFGPWFLSWVLVFKANELKKCVTFILSALTLISNFMPFTEIRLALPALETVKNWRIRKDPGDFPGGPVAKTPSSQWRGQGFGPWSGN